MGEGGMVMNKLSFESRTSTIRDIQHEKKKLRLFIRLRFTK